MIDRERIYEALSTVRDPELDESITSLGFVEGVEATDDEVHVHLRLPTYFCAPNFAYLMVADAKTALQSLPEVGRARITLIDHFSSSEINEGIEQDKSFQATFPGEANEELDEVRDLFRRKAFVSRQEKLCRLLLRQGHSTESLAHMSLGDLPWSPETDAYLDRRRELGLDISSGAPFLIDPRGRRIASAEAGEHLRFARLMGTSIEANGSMCRALLADRYGVPDQEGALL